MGVGGGGGESQKHQLNKLKSTIMTNAATTAAATANSSLTAAMHSEAPSNNSKTATSNIN